MGVSPVLSFFCSVNYGRNLAVCGNEIRYETGQRDFQDCVGVQTRADQGLVVVNEVQHSPDYQRHTDSAPNGVELTSTR